MTRVAVVTGASQGVGLEVCARLLKAGWAVVGLARQPRGFQALIDANPKNASYQPVDVTQAATVAAAFRAIAERYGSIRLLVNNAAVFQLKQYTEYSLADVDALL